MEDYLSRPSSFTVDPFEFWRCEVNSANYPLIKQLSVRYLSAPLTCEESELSNTAVNLIHANDALPPESLEKLLFLQQNVPVLGFQWKRVLHNKCELWDEKILGTRSLWWTLDPTWFIVIISLGFRSKKNSPGLLPYWLFMLTVATILPPIVALWQEFIWIIWLHLWARVAQSVKEPTHQRIMVQDCGRSMPSETVNWY